MAPFSEAEPALFDHERLNRARRLVEEFIAGRADLFTYRAREGFACDGHGDLQAADIYCLDDGPRILDCIEFDDALRYVDVTDDIAFLMMDLERLGAVDAAGLLAQSYAEFAGHPLPARSCTITSPIALSSGPRCPPFDGNKNTTAATSTRPKPPCGPPAPRPVR